MAREYFLFEFMRESSTSETDNFCEGDEMMQNVSERKREGL
jgi:hypothetical protein